MTMITPLAFLGGAGMLAVALGYLVYVAVRRLSGAYLALGALAWVVTVVVKFAWAIPVNTHVYNAVTGALPGLPGLLVVSLYVGSLTGFTEVLITWLVLRYTRLGRVPWGKALAFGIGFGAVEALLLGISNVASVAVAILAPQSLPGGTAQAFANIANPLWGLAPIVERFFTVLIHVGSCALIFLAVARQHSGWMWLAFLLKSLIDSVGGYGQLIGINSLATVWTLEAVVAVFGVVGWLIVRYVAAVYPQTEVPAALENAQPVPAV